MIGSVLVALGLHQADSVGQVTLEGVDSGVESLIVKGRFENHGVVGFHRNSNLYHTII